MRSVASCRILGINALEEQARLGKQPRRTDRKTEFGVSKRGIASKLSILEACVDHASKELHADLSTKQLRAFLVLAKASIEEDPLNQEDLVRVLAMPKQTASDTLKRFVARGVIEQVQSKEDRRVKNLELTERGYILAQQLAECFEPVARANDHQHRQSQHIRNSRH